MTRICSANTAMLAASNPANVSNWARKRSNARCSSALNSRALQKFNATWTATCATVTSTSAASRPRLSHLCCDDQNGRMKRAKRLRNPV
ncbi:MAG: hypothetical protein WDN04_17325 [Rhodospirillales bacterium]